MLRTLFVALSALAVLTGCQQPSPRTVSVETQTWNSRSGAVSQEGGASIDAVEGSNVTLPSNVGHLTITVSAVRDGAVTLEFNQPMARGHHDEEQAADKPSTSFDLAPGDELRLSTETLDAGSDVTLRLDD